MLTAALATQMKAHCVERVRALPEPTHQLMLVGPFERRATAHCFGGRLNASGPASRRSRPSTDAGQTNALMPVMLRPTIKVFISRVPS
jgi:hypothetical protein